jgi:hypothetical protein
VAYAVLTGHPDETIVGQLSPSGFPADQLHEYLQTLRTSPLAAVGHEFAIQLRQTRWLLQLQKNVQGNSTAWLSGQVPRIDSSEVERFQQDFLAANRPVIIEGLIDNWPARVEWNQESLSRRHGSHPIEYTRYYVEDNQHKPEQVQADFASFLSLVYDPNYEEPIYWTAYNQGDQASPLVQGLSEDIVIPEQYCQANPDMRTYFWIGPAGTRSGLHFDPYNVLFAQVQGHKRFLLYPPQDIPDAYLENDFFSVVDAEAPDLHRFPKFAETKPLVVDLGPGEVMLLPVGWLHQVRSLSVSASVSLTCLKLPNGTLNSYPAPSHYQGLL